MPVTIKRKPAFTLAQGPLPEFQSFHCMLAASEIPKEKDLFFPLMTSLKYDGIRSPMTGGFAMSRKMLKLPNLFVQAWAQEWGRELHGLDGELIVGPPNIPDVTFNTSTSGINSADGEPDFKFYVFEKWDSMGTARNRYRELLATVEKMPSKLLDRIVLVIQDEVDSPAELRWHADRAIKAGYEGLIMKDPSLLYKFGRSTIKGGHALKWKEFMDFTCEIIEVKQGMKNMNVAVKDELGHAKRSSAKAGKVPVNEVGGFVVRCVEPECIYFNKVFSCGPGFLTDAQLKMLWAIKGQLPGKLTRVKSQKVGAVNLPRFPGFWGFLDFPVL